MNKYSTTLKNLFNGKLKTRKLHLSLTPCCRRATKLCFEDTVKLCAGREATLGRDNIIAIVREILHHLLGGIKTDVAEPYTEGGT